MGDFYDHVCQLILKVRLFQQTSKQKIMENRQRYRKVFPDVLIHNDTWQGNILFEKHAEEIGNRVSAIIDWQMCCRGSCFIDLSRLATFCVCNELREKFEKFVTKRWIFPTFCNARQIFLFSSKSRYYDRMMTKCGEKFNLPAFDAFWQAYQHANAFTGLKIVALTSFLLDDGGNEERKRRLIIEKIKYTYESAERFFTDMINDIYWSKVYVR